MNETMVYDSNYRTELEEVMAACARPSHYAFVKDGLPDGFAIEVGHSGKVFIPKYSYQERGYFAFYTRDLSKPVLPGRNSYEEVMYGSFEEAEAFIHQFVGFLQWMGKIAQ